MSSKRFSSIQHNIFLLSGRNKDEYKTDLKHSHKIVEIIITKKNIYHQAVVELWRALSTIYVQTYAIILATTTAIS